MSSYTIKSRLTGQDQNKNPTHSVNLQSRAFVGQNDGTNVDIYTPGGGHE